MMSSISAFVAHDRPCRAIQALIVPAHQDLEQTTVSSQDALYQLCIGQRVGGRRCPSR